LSSEQFSLFNHIIEHSKISHVSRFLAVIDQHTWTWSCFSVYSCCGESEVWFLS